MHLPNKNILNELDFLRFFYHCFKYIGSIDYRKDYDYLKLSLNCFIYSAHARL